MWKMYVFFCADPVQVLKTALQGAGKLQDAPNPSLTPLGAPGWGKHPEHHLTPVPVSLEEAAKALGGIPGSGQVPNPGYSWALLALQSRPGPLQGLWAPSSSTALEGTVPLEAESSFSEQGLKRSGRKSRAKTTEGVGVQMVPGEHSGEVLKPSPRDMEKAG